MLGDHLAEFGRVQDEEQRPRNRSPVVLDPYRTGHGLAKVETEWTCGSFPPLTTLYYLIITSPTESAPFHQPRNVYCPAGSPHPVLIIS